LSTETEIKVKIDDPEDFCRQLLALNPGVLSVRHFEDNRLMDFPDKKLGTGRCMVRVRCALDRALLTFKGPPQESEIFKIREEIETGLDDGNQAIRILERLGLRVWFQYQKYRREYTVDSVTVAIDETPIGNYAELEGGESAIRDLSRRLNIEESKFIRKSYYALYLDACRLQHVAPGNMVF
jgi:adenylate cyclase class 2